MRINDKEYEVGDVIYDAYSNKELPHKVFNCSYGCVHAVFYDEESEQWHYLGKSSGGGKSYWTSNYNQVLNEVDKWADLIKRHHAQDPSTDSNVVVVNDTIMYVGREDDTPNSCRGFAGRTWCLLALNEGTPSFVSTNMWHTGTVCEEIADRFPVTHKSVSRDEFEQVYGDSTPGQYGSTSSVQACKSNYTPEQGNIIGD